MATHHTRRKPTSSESSSSSGTSTPNLGSAWSMPLPSTVSNAVSGLLRRFSTEHSSSSSHTTHSTMHSSALQQSKSSHANGVDQVYTPPYRTASPFQPPPLYPVNLSGYDKSTTASARLLTKALAEEIRLLVPPRLQLCENWQLVYSLEEHGVSLGTLYKNCFNFRGVRNGFVLVVRDGEGGLFGAYLTEAPHPSPHYFGTGECFLWRASILSASSIPQLSALPPPPSADTTNMQRSTTLAFPSSSSSNNLSPSFPPAQATSLGPPHSPNTGASTPERIRFKAFPYSGVNDYLMLCEQGFLSVGGGDGHYGLWLDNSFEKGISSHCLTFGNEPLSDEGEKFDILGVEVWSLGI